MTELLPIIVVNTLVLGVMYILAALGFAFIFNMLGTINLAHGALYMTGAYLTFYLSFFLGLNNWMALVCTCLILIVLGFFLERYCYRPFYGSFKRIVMISVALMTTLQTTSILLTGARTFITDSFASGRVNLGFMMLSSERLLMFAIGLGLLLITMFIVYRTKLGMQMSAVAQNRTGAALQGINIFKVSSIVFALGCGLAAVSGGLMGAYQAITPYMGDGMQIRILMLVMLAGAGSMSGIIITGALMAFVDIIFPMYFQSFVAASLSVGVIIILLLIRPKGFFGHEK